MMNATAPITSISQSLLNRTDVKGTSLEEGIEAIHDTSCHLSDFVTSYRKMSKLEKPTLKDVRISTITNEISKAYPELTWDINIPSDLTARADVSMLRQVLINLVKNATEANATRLVVEEITPHSSLYVGNDGLPIPAENRQSLFVPFFTTKRSGSGIGLSLSRRMMIQQGGMLDLAESPRRGCHVAFVLSFSAGGIGFAPQAS
jgi:signal transduction histidine kinase